MKLKTKNKIKLIGMLLCTNFVIYGIAYGQFEEWKKDIKPGLDVIEQKHSLEEFKIAKWIYEPTAVTIENKEVLNTDNEKVNAVVVTTTTEVKPQEEAGNNQSPKVEDLIKKHFPDNADNMIKLFTCESGLKNDTTGDKDLSTTQWYNGELLGRSIGVSQIRTGAVEKNGTVWSRAWKHGISVKEYEDKLRDPDFNLSEAKKVFESKGYYGWENCARNNNLIK